MTAWPRVSAFSQIRETPEKLRLHLSNLRYLQFKSIFMLTWGSTQVGSRRQMAGMKLSREHTTESYLHSVHSVARGGKGILPGHRCV